MQQMSRCNNTCGIFLTMLSLTFFHVVNNSYKFNDNNLIKQTWLKFIIFLFYKTLRAL